MIESHRRDVARKEQEAFEAAEIARLNSVTVDGPSIAEPAGDPGFVGSSFSMQNRLLRPPVDKEKEQMQVLDTISRVLSGAPSEDPDHNRNTTWMAFIDQEDGTLTYYNNVTGLKTKNRPRDFDGTLPTASSSLTSNWTLKFDPTKGAKYYHNLATGEIRWLEPPRPSSTPVPPPRKDQSSSVPPSIPIKMEPSTSETTATRSSSQIRIKLEPTESQSPEIPTPPPPAAVPIKPEPEDQSQGADVYEPSHQSTEDRPEPPKEQYAAPPIGQWEVVKPEESAFSHSIVSIEPYINPPPAPPRDPDILDVIRDATYETPLLNVDDMQLQEKQVFTKHKADALDAEAPVKFAKRKIPKKR
ncbi:WW domain-binding protein 4, putative [Babesia ovata]|uniref:WW domain-binding protein 4, putative n=1 Tax=Babesia ovata TaxID=189622 RepID=A0A2H6K6S7_9APIC|nr:WW domain-binding protein 4, putative [Babesia ovata]GBE58691.1 WW domain-binding protein 4, putative [Babesia ovata]